MASCLEQWLDKWLERREAQVQQLSCHQRARANSKPSPVWVYYDYYGLLLEDLATWIRTTNDFNLQQSFTRFMCGQCPLAFGFQFGNPAPRFCAAKLRRKPKRAQPHFLGSKGMNIGDSSQNIGNLLGCAWRYGPPKSTGESSHYHPYYIK